MLPKIYHLPPLKSQFRKAAKLLVVRAATSNVFLGKDALRRLLRDSCVAAARGGQGGGFGASTWARMERSGGKDEASRG